MKVIKGDLLHAASEGKLQFIMHGCNCFHAMGGGIAKLIAERFPLAAKADREQTERGDPGKLGSYTQARVYTKDSAGQHVEFDVINLYTQYAPGKDFLPSVFPKAIERINNDFAGQTIGIPLIGCGIAGGDWAFVMNTLLTHAPDVNWEVFVL